MVWRIKLTKNERDTLKDFVAKLIATSYKAGRAIEKADKQEISMAENNQAIEEMNNAIADINFHIERLI